MPDDLLGGRLARTNLDDEANDQVGEVEVAVEALGGGAKVAMDALGVAEPCRRRGPPSFRLETKTHTSCPYAP